jgi:glycosyltransferase involved in cell wall biosynthesis
MNRVSVVIPTYNHAKYVLEAIESVLASEIVNPEIIVVNDGSPDNTHELLKDLPGIRYFRTENHGAHSALNFGIEKSTHDYVAILNDDDLFLPNHLIGCLRDLEATNADIVVSRFEAFGTGPLLVQIKNHMKIMEKRIEHFGLLKSLLQVNWAVSTSGFFFKKSIWQANKGFSPLSMCHDYEFLLSAIVHASAAIYYSNRIDWRYRCHSENSSHKVDSEERRAQWYAATFISFDLYPRHIQDYLNEISLEHLGIDSDLFGRILYSLDSIDRTEINFGLERIRDLLISTK